MKRIGIAIVLAVILCTAVLLISVFHVAPDHSNNVNDDNGILGRPLRVGVVSWPGYAGGIVANDGFRPNKTCIYWERHKLLVEFVLMEDVNVRAKSFARGGIGDVDIVWTTVDFWANELPGFIEGGVPAKAIMQVSWSRGGDAIVVDKSINSIEELQGKKIALALLTPSHWFLEYSLQKSKLSEQQIIDITKSLVGKDSSPDARQEFVAGNVDAAVVWEPDVTEALKHRDGAKILVSTKTENRLLADFMVAREEFIKQHPQVIDTFIRGWLEGTAVAENDHALVARLLTENEPVYKELGNAATLEQLGTVRWADINDNIEMFGLDGNKPLFNELFISASAIWLKRGFIKSAVDPNTAADTTFLRDISIITQSAP